MVLPWRPTIQQLSETAIQEVGRMNKHGEHWHLGSYEILHVLRWQEFLSIVGFVSKNSLYINITYTFYTISIAQTKRFDAAAYLLDSPNIYQSHLPKTVYFEKKTLSQNPIQNPCVQSTKTSELYKTTPPNPYMAEIHVDASSL